MENQTHHRRNAPRRGLEWLIASTIGLASGFTGLATQARLEFHKKLIDYWNDQPHLKVELEEHGQTLENLTTDRAMGNITTAEYVAKSHAQKDLFSEKLSSFSREKLGMKTGGLEGFFEGTIKRFRYMGKDTRTPIAFAAIVATGVGAAGTMMFFNSLKVHDKLNSLADQLDNSKER